jgi:hypothetical protein
VLEVNRPDLAMHRSNEKTDLTDAENPAHAVLAGRATTIPRHSQTPCRHNARRVRCETQCSQGEDTSDQSVASLAGERTSGHARLCSESENLQLSWRLRAPLFSGKDAHVADAGDHAAVAGEALVDVEE